MSPARTTGIALALLGVAVTPALATDPPMREGLWEITTRMEMPGMPAQAHTQTHCYTKAEAEEARKSVPAAGPAGQCKMVEQKQSGNTMTFKVQCDGGMTSTGQMTHRRDAYEGVITMTGSGMNMTQRIAGTRIGDCTK